MLRQRFRTQLFVARIQSALSRVFALAVQQMSQVMQQRRRHQCFLAAFALHKPGRLQAVLQHRHRLAKVSLAAARRQQFKDAFR